MSLRTLAFPVRIAALAAIVATGFALSGCADDQIQAATYVERPVEQIYSDAWAQINQGNWIQAGQQFDEVERQHPYSVWARRAMLMSAYCYYQANRYDQATKTLDSFIQLHPGNKDVPYAYYLKAISLYEQIADVNRDQAKTQQALTALQDLVQRYPNTPYARDARLKIDLARDHLAGKEMAVGRFYLRSGDPLAAILRFRTVVDKYQTTSQTPEALERLTEAYMTLGMVDEAKHAAAVLGYNYPGSAWYQDAYNLVTQANAAPQESQQSWFDKAYDAVF